jgi:UDP:flavonoid glycosyltransferase YjiC (YdhE family)
VLPAILEAVGALPIRGLLTLGGAVAPESVLAPANVTVRGHVPHEGVLPSMSAVVTHGGLATITTALAFGVPLVCLPQGREQPLNAARVEAVRAGRSLPGDSPASAIAGAVVEVLSNRSIRQAAARFVSSDRGDTAARLTEELLRDSRV